MALFKKFDEGRNNLEGEITEAAVTKFVAGNALPLVVDFNQETAQKIFSGKLVALPPPLPPTLLSKPYISSTVVGINCRIRSYLSDPDPTS